MDCIATKFLVVLLSLWLSCIHAIQTGRFPAILAFGDSILDTGNNNKLMTVSKSNFLPYGRNFPYHIPTGRFGNGRVLSDLVGILFFIQLIIKQILKYYLTMEYKLTVTYSYILKNEMS